MNPLSLDFVLISSIIIFFAYFVKGVTGFGAGPIRNSLWLFFTDIKFAAPTGILFAILGNLSIFWTCHKHINKRLLLWLGGGSLLGNVIGCYFFVSTPSEILSVLFGIFMLLYGISSFLKPIKAHKSGNIINFVVGILAGAVGGLFGGGSAVIIALWLDRHGLKKDEFRANLVLIYLMGNIVRVAVYALAGLYTLEIFEFTALLIPAFVVGIVLGNRAHKGISEARFRKIVALMLTAIGVLLLAKFLA